MFACDLKSIAVIAERKESIAVGSEAGRVVKGVRSDGRGIE